MLNPTGLEPVLPVWKTGVLSKLDEGYWEKYKAVVKDGVDATGFEPVTPTCKVGVFPEH